MYDKPVPPKKLKVLVEWLLKFDPDLEFDIRFIQWYWNVPTGTIHNARNWIKQNYGNKNR